jgi:hypothetical protein
VRSVEDLGKRTLRELLTLARERFGSRAATLKTRAELLAALTAPTENSTPAPPSPVVAPPAPVREIIVKDFFRRRGP